MKSNSINNETRIITIKKQGGKACLPEGRFCGHNCADGCIYWNPRDRDYNGRQYCSWYDSYYYPRERQGCLSFKG